MKDSFWKKYIKNPQLLETYKVKMHILTLIREFFASKHIMEVEAPILQTSLIPESYLDVFETNEKRIGLEGKVEQPVYLLPSPESFLKKMMVAGIGSNFAITKSFRNGEPLSGKHLSEFTMLEWYQKDSDYTDVMETTTELFNFIVKHITGSEKITYRGTAVDFSAPWKRMSIRDAFIQYCDLDLEQSYDRETKKFSVEHLYALIKTEGITKTDSTTWEQLYNQLFLTYVEPNLPTDKPVILYDFPAPLSPLAIAKNGVTVAEPLWAERFEVMVAGLELCDTYSENTDALKQTLAYDNEILSLQEKGKIVPTPDYDFIDALEVGLPRCSGNAVGVDRLVMLCTNSESIEFAEFL